MKKKAADGWVLATGRERKSDWEKKASRRRYAEPEKKHVF